MQTQITQDFKMSSAGKIAGDILRSCVHCGFCQATCPTYQILGDELDSPRGRIYLIKQMLEGHAVTETTQLHLDRCLTCRSCETTCPSGVQYGRLLDIGRAMVNERVQRPWLERFKRGVLKAVLPYPKRFSTLMGLGQLARPLLPTVLKKMIPVKERLPTLVVRHHTRKMLVLAGCAQPALRPQINHATTRVLDRLGIELISVKEAGCCGAVDHHLDDHAKAKLRIKTNIDAWWPLIQSQNIEAIVMTASGCGVMVKDYAYLLTDDIDYAKKAKTISDMTRDLSEVLAQEDVSVLKITGNNRVIAFHPPCTLQHGQQITGVVEEILQACGYQLNAITDTHLCCGSAGTYSLLQPKLSRELRQRKLDCLQHDKPECIVTANIGCLHHLQEGTDVPVKHWIELLT